MMQDWAGWLLMLFSFSIVLMWKSVRSDTKLVHAIWFCIVVHHVVAFLNAYVGTVIGAGQDAAKFHTTGVKLCNKTNVLLSVYSIFDFDLSDQHISNLFPFLDTTYQLTHQIGTLDTYSHSLGFLYSTLGASHFFGEELSVLAFTMSCVILVKLVDLLDLGRFRIGIILLFGLLPSAVIFRSVTLRESWQALFFLLFVYWAVRLRKRPDILIVSFLLMSAFCLVSLHNSLKVYVIFMIVISVYWGIFGCKKGVYWARHVMFLLIGLLVACTITLTLKIGWFMYIGQVLETAEAYRVAAATMHGRTTYGVMLDTSSVLGFVKTVPMVYVLYMFAPFPWQVGNVNDIYAFLESMLRFALLFFAVYSWRRSSGEVRSNYSFLLIAVLGIELMWAVGTINWGTATRHHVPGYSVLVLLGAPGLILFMRELHFGMFGCRKDNTMLPK